jgi:hypothetical protein
MRSQSSLMLAALLLCSAVLFAQAPESNQTPPAGPASAVPVKGTVVDATGGVMVNADVQLATGTPSRVVVSGKTDSQGEFELRAAPGQYLLKIAASDFKDISQQVRVTADMAPLSLTMVLSISTQVEVTSTDSSDLSVDPDSSLNTDVITGDALLDLPDNPDDLLAYLIQLAQLRGGEGDVTINVDGFNGADIPPLAQIAEIRIINTSFTADGSTGPRIEIVTKAGSGKWTATTTDSFNDESLNAHNHLTSGKRPKSQTRNISLNSSGPIIKDRLSLNANIANNESDQGGSDLRAVTPNGFVSNGVTSINAGRNFTLSPRLKISKNQNLTTAFSYRSTDTTNSGIGGFTLPERAANSRNRNWQFQLSDRITRGKSVDTFRFQEQHGDTGTVPVTSFGYALNVTGAFNGGASPNRTHNSPENFLLGNSLQWQPKPKLSFSALAFELNYHRSDTNNQSNYNGTYTFASLYDYCATLNPIFSGSQCQIELAKRQDLQDLNPSLDITPAPPVTFTQTGGTSEIKLSQAELAMWAQGDWRYSPRIDVSFGLRYQIQQHFHDYNNFAPVLGVSYQLRAKGNWKTVIRTGVKVVDSTFPINSYQQFQQYGADSDQHSISINSPSYPDPTQGGTIAVNTAVATRQLAGDAVMPYQMNPTFTWEQSMPRGMALVGTVGVTRFFRQNRSVNINAPYPGTPLPSEILQDLKSFDPTIKANATAYVNSLRPFYPEGIVGNIDQTESVGRGTTKNVSLQYRVTNYPLFHNKVRVTGSITYNVLHGMDDSQFENPYNRLADWGRTAGTGQRFNTTLTLNMPRRVTLALTNIGRTSGRPYSVTLGSDANGDSSNNDRPDQATCIAFNIPPSQCSRNGATGPGSISLPQARLTKIFILSTPSSQTSPSLGRLVSSFADPAQGGGGGGGGGFSGGGGGGAGGNRAGGSTTNNPNRVPTGARTLSFSIQAANFLNSATNTTINGVLSSPLFGTLTSGSPGRKITLSMTMKLF